MSTSLLYHGFGIRGYAYVRTEYDHGQVSFAIRQDPDTLRCVSGRTKPASDGRVRIGHLEEVVIRVMAFFGHDGTCLPPHAAGMVKPAPHPAAGRPAQSPSAAGRAETSY